MTFPAVLAALLRADAARPLVTFYDDATGERIELSVATYANWVAKTAGLAQDELDARARRPGARRPADALAGRGLAGCGLEPRADGHRRPGAGRARRTSWSAAPTASATYAAHADRVPVVALSLRPLGGRFTEALPTGVTDFGAVVLAQPDAFVAYDPPAAARRRLARRGGHPSQADLLAEAAASGLVAAGGRLLTDVDPVHPRAVWCTLLAPLALGAATVWVRTPRRVRLAGPGRAGAGHRAAPGLTPTGRCSADEVEATHVAGAVGPAGPKPPAVPGSSHSRPVEASRTTRSARRSPVRSPAGDHPVVGRCRARRRGCRR